MTWLLCLAALWIVVSCGASLVIGRGLRWAEKTDSLQRARGPVPSYDPEITRQRRLAG
jgi:hypothetical protein